MYIRHTIRLDKQIIAKVVQKNQENIVFVATSLDGYIADKDGGIEWLKHVPNPDNIDMGFLPLMERVDAMIMGRKTFEMVDSFDIEWPYAVPTFLLSNTLTTVPDKYKGKVELLRGTPKSLLKQINDKGFYTLYIDGGATIQRFLQEGLIDELTISTIPIILGDGIPLFANLAEQIPLQYVKTEVYLDAIVQNTYKVKK